MIQSIKFENMIRFAREIERLWGRQLHAGGEFVTLDARLKELIFRIMLGVQLIEGVDR